MVLSQYYFQSCISAVTASLCHGWGEGSMFLLFYFSISRVLLCKIYHWLERRPWFSCFTFSLLQTPVHWNLSDEVPQYYISPRDNKLCLLYSARFYTKIRDKWLLCLMAVQGQCYESISLSLKCEHPKVKSFVLFI